MPVAVVAGEARCIIAEHQPGMAETNFCDQTLEPKAVLGLGAGFPEIIVDDLDAFARPTQTESPINQPILQLGAFLMMSDLANARLANIDIGELCALDGADPII
ncbi:MAG: hypothetical protein NVS3B5_05720 [Sphingomicrobium sp.]